MTAGAGLLDPVLLEQAQAAHVATGPVTLVAGVPHLPTSDDGLVPVGLDVVAAAVEVHDAGSEVPRAVLRLAATDEVTSVSSIGGGFWAVTGGSSAEQVAAVAGVPAAAVTRDAVGYLLSDDTHYQHLWALENTGVYDFGAGPSTPDADIDGKEAWGASTGDGVLVAIVDTGISSSHPDLPTLAGNPGGDCGDGVDDDGNGYVDDCRGSDFQNHDNSVDDTGSDNGHGTHVAGTIAAKVDNGQGVAGVAPGVDVMSLKVTNGGAFSMGNAAAAIRYAADQGADVVNLSIGTSPGIPASSMGYLLAAIDYAQSKGTFLVVAAGNDGVNIDSAPVWPASAPQSNVITVGASTSAETRAWFSNFGTVSVDIMAPGHYVASTVPGGYGIKQGTSMVAPHVTAVATLVEGLGDLPPDQLRQRLLTTADVRAPYLGAVGGAGRLNAARAVGLNPDAVTGSFAATFEGLDTLEAEVAGDFTVTASGLPAEASSAPGAAWRARLFVDVNGQAWQVTDLPAVVNGSASGFDGSGDLPAGPATSGALTLAAGVTLPPGSYALLVDVVDGQGDVLTDAQAAFFQITDPDAPTPTVPPGGGGGPTTTAPPGSDGDGGGPPTTVPAGGGGGGGPTTTVPSGGGGGGPTTTVPAGGGGATTTTVPPGGGGGGGGATTTTAPQMTTTTIGAVPSTTTPTSPVPDATYRGLRVRPAPAGLFGEQPPATWGQVSCGSTCAGRTI